MKKHFLKSLLAIASLLCSISIYAHEFEVDGIYYNITNTVNKTVEVTFRGSNYNSYDDEYTGLVIIPETVVYYGVNYSVTSIGDDAFSLCTGLTSVTIPNSVTSIGWLAFYGCRGLTSITIPNSVTSIGRSAFYWCSGLTSVTIPNSVTSIDGYAFWGCTGLTEVTIPNSVTELGDYAFSDCKGMTTVNFNAENCTTMGSSSYPVFEGCNNLTTINIGENVKAIPNYAFSGCASLTEINIPNSVTSIGEDAFLGCTGLKEVTIPNSVTSIGDGAFYKCTGLTEITIPNSVTSIGKGAFRFCYGLTEITIPNSVTFIGSSAFYNCIGLAIVNFKAENCTTMGSSNYPVFSGCSNLIAVNIGESVKTIPAYAFSGCTGLTEVTIGNCVTSIGRSAFSGCTGLKEITITDNVTSIGDYAFDKCDRIKEVYAYPTAPPQIGLNTFTVYVNDNATLHVPDGCKTAYQEAEYWEHFANIEEIINEVLAESIVLNYNNLTAIVGETYLLTATIYPEDATEKGVVWSVSDESIVTIESIDGLNATIKILQAGVATITVETIDGSYLTATCEIDAVSAINQTMSDTANAEYYTIDGLKLAKKPSHGIYIMKQGNTVRKVVL